MKSIVKDKLTVNIYPTRDEMGKAAGQKAAELLRSTDYTVEYISEKLNFSSPMYLRKVLFANFGKTPREIRKEKQELI